MNMHLKFWLRIALFNFLLVALLGVTLRYKIVFSLPFVDQKHLLHAHSHFAFAGWISQLLMAFMVYYLYTQNDQAFKKYKALLYTNLFAAYGMLLSFPFQGYGAISISFSTLSILVSYWFAVQYWRDLNKLRQRSTTHSWFKAANLFAVISSLGAFALAWMMANKTVHQNWYLASTYFFLHFQYNGWFLFGCAGLFNWILNRNNITIPAARNIFWLFALACIPAYFLSALWLPISNWVYILVVIAACLQMAGWLLFIIQVKRALKLLSQLPTTSKWLLGLSAAALTIKLLLQLGSTIPSLSDLAFGFRPIVIGYLHLVLLAVISLFLLGAAIALGQLRVSRFFITGIITLILGVFLNELLLMVQGSAAMSYNNVPYTNELLLAIAFIMFSGILFINISQRKHHFPEVES
jgi:hypothetical protein